MNRQLEQNQKWIYAALLFIVAVSHAMLTNPKQQVIKTRQLDAGIKKRPHCAELIKREAKICRYCSQELTFAQQRVAFLSSPYES